MQYDIYLSRINTKTSVLMSLTKEFKEKLFYYKNLAKVKQNILSLGFIDIEQLYFEFFPESKQRKEFVQKVLSRSVQSKDIVSKLNDMYIMLKNE